MKVATGCARAGVDVKNKISPILREIDMELTDFGTTSTESVDYPDFGEKVSHEVSKGTAERGILICGTGIGMSIVANKFLGVRAVPSATIRTLQR